MPSKWFGVRNPVVVIAAFTAVVSAIPTWRGYESDVPLEKATWFLAAATAALVGSTLITAILASLSARQTLAFFERTERERRQLERDLADQRRIEDTLRAQFGPGWREVLAAMKSKVNYAGFNEVLKPFGVSVARFDALFPEVEEMAARIGDRQ